MALFGTKKQQQMPPSLDGPPTDKVLAMRQQGISNHQIVQQLQREGYTSTHIFDAMNQADIKGGVETMAEGPGMHEEELRNPASLQGAMPPPMPGFDMGSMGNQQMQQQNMQPSPIQEYQLEGRSAGPLEVERIEEIAEAIIDEKWNDLVKSINKIVEWKERIESRIAKIEQEVSDLKQDFTALHQGILGKIGEYDKNLTNIGTEIQAMERVFQKTLPTFTENISELNRITADIKKNIGEKIPSKKVKE